MTLPPSEVVVLHGARFAPAAGRFTSRFPLLDGSPDADRDQLAVAALRAALLGLERDGFLRLTYTRPKALFGLVKRHAVTAEPTGAPGAPEGRVEAGLLAALGTVEAPAEVDAVVTAWLATDRDSPHADVLADITTDLVTRGLVERTVEEKRVLLMKTRTEHATLTHAGRQALAETDPAPVQALFDAAAARGEFDKRLTNEIVQGFVARTIQQDGPDMDWD